MTFQIQGATRVTSRQPPHAVEWWDRSLGQDDPVEQITRLRRQLGLAIMEAGRRPLFLRALGRDIDEALQDLLGRATFGVGELTSELRERRQLLEKTVDHFCDVVAPSGRAFRSIELSDCAREAVAELSSEMRLCLLIQGEPRVAASRRLVTSLLEVAIRSASARTTEEVEVILPPCSGTLAQFRIGWPKSSTTDDNCTRDNYDRARFFALTVAYAMKLGGTLIRDTGDREILTVELPMANHAEHNASLTPFLEPDVLGQAVLS